MSLWDQWIASGKLISPSLLVKGILRKFGFLPNKPRREFLNSVIKLLLLQNYGRTQTICGTYSQ